MAVCSTRLLLALVAVTLAAVAPSAMAQSPVPEQRTHVDASDPPAQQAGDAGDEWPRLTLLQAGTKARDVRRGFLYVKARCSLRCEVAVTAKTKIGRRWRVIASVTRVLPARRTTRIRLRIRSDLRRRIPGTARFVYHAMPFPPA